MASDPGRNARDGHSYLTAKLISSDSFELLKKKYSRNTFPIILNHIQEENTLHLQLKAS